MAMRESIDVVVLQVAGGFVVAVLVLAGLVIGGALVTYRADSDSGRTGQQILVLALAGALAGLYVVFLR